jgi:small GTP-binding protein
MAGALKANVVVVGDSQVGKSALIYSIANDGKFSDESPADSDSPNGSYLSGRLIEGEPILFDLWDTSGKEDFLRLRKPSYPNVDMFFMCFAVDSPASFHKVKSTHMEIQDELRNENENRNVPVVLVGTKADRRSETCQGLTLVPRARGEQLCADIGGE